MLAVDDDPLILDLLEDRSRRLLAAEELFERERGAGTRGSREPGEPLDGFAPSLVDAVEQVVGTQAGAALRR